LAAHSRGRSSERSLPVQSGTIVGAATGGFLGSLFGHDEEKHKGFAEGFRGLQEMANEPKPQVGALTKIGLGGFGGAGGPGDLLLSESRRHTSLLEQVRDALREGRSLTLAGEKVPV
jgi:hypothetical protein